MKLLIASSRYEHLSIAPKSQDYVLKLYIDIDSTNSLIELTSMLVYIIF